MKNETDRQITRHSLPTRMCYNFFYPPHKNFEILPTHIAHIAKAPRANASTKVLSKISISYKEARETIYWLRLLQATDYLSEIEAKNLIDDAEELCKILGKIQLTLKSRNS